MKLLFVGTSHGIPERDRFCTSTFLQTHGRLYIIDAGAPISPLIKKYGFEHKDVKAIFVSHLHGDHFEGLPEFCDQIGWFYTNSNPKFLLPDDRGVYLLSTWVNTMRPDTRALDFNTYSPGVIYEDECIRVSAIPTKHIQNAYSFLVEAEGKKLFFTGDMSNDFPEYSELLGSERYDLVVCEGAHSRYDTCADSIAATNTSKMVVNHIAPRMLESIRQFGETSPFEFIVSYDGMELEI